MKIDVPADILETLSLIADRSGESVEEAINSGIRFFIMIHFMPYEDQAALKAIISKTYDDVKLKGLH